jgi:2-polyprenyl-6-methoxyphenol hydroxylase-like FAD-dependent oxidoreductase
MAASSFRVIIVGGGPVGLTSAHALFLAEIDFIILERRDSIILDQGASLVLGPNSLRVMHQLGLLDTLLGIGSEFKHQKIFTVDGHKFKDNTATLRLFKKK